MWFHENEVLKEQGNQGINDTLELKILRFCSSKKSLTYYELQEQFSHNVLSDELSLNDNLLGKFLEKAGKLKYFLYICIVNSIIMVSHHEKQEVINILNDVLGYSTSMKNDEQAYYCPFCHHHKKKLQVNLKTQK